MEDSLVAIAVATLLFISSQAPDQKQSFLSSEKTMVLIESLLQVITMCIIFTQTYTLVKFGVSYHSVHI